MTANPSGQITHKRNADFVRTFTISNLPSGTVLSSATLGVRSAPSDTGSELLELAGSSISTSGTTATVTFGAAGNQATIAAALTAGIYYYDIQGTLDNSQVIATDNFILKVVEGVTYA